MNKEILEQYTNEYKTIEEMSQLLNKSKTTVRYWLEKFELKTKNKVGPKPSNTEGKCVVCEKTTLNNKMYCSDNCKAKNYLINNPDKKILINLKNQVKNQTFKQLAVNYKGGKCSICHYNKNLAALSFHHLNPKEKDLEISKFNRSNTLEKKHIDELDKCILLCENCHQEEHHRLNSLIQNPSKQTIKGKKVRAQLLEYKGGKCIKCSYNKCPSVLSFHHVDESSKEFNIDNRVCNGYKYERLLKEVDKCVILCQVCHQEEHHPELLNTN